MRENFHSLSHDQPLIEIKINSVQQLFDARDPAPFRAKDLDDDFVEYIVAAADELSVHKNLEIFIHIAKRDFEDIGPESIAESIRSFFLYQVDLKRLQLTKLFRMARLFLFLGSFVLVGCLLASRFLEVNFHEDSPFRTILREGVIIFGWVSLWKPFEILLFDWYPVYDRMRLFKNLSQSDIKIL